MARIKGIAYRSPSALDLRIPKPPRDLANLAASAVSLPDFVKQIVRLTDIHTKSILTDMITTHKLKVTKRQQSNLTKADGIIAAHLAKEAVSKEALAWAIETCGKEQALEDAENAKLAADGATSTIAPLTATNLSAHGGDVASVVKGSSTLSPSISNYADLDPAEANFECAPRPQPSQPQQDPKMLSEAARQHRKFLTAAVASLEYNTDPADRPSWLTGLKKPLPHVDLSAMQNFEIQTRFWDDEIARVTKWRAGLPLPQNPTGEWTYEHFGSTIEVSKQAGKKTSRVCARGLWKYEDGGRNPKQLLDEFPLDWTGQPLGWDTQKELEKFRLYENEAEDKVDGGEGKKFVQTESSKSGKDEGKGKKTVAFLDGANDLEETTDAYEYVMDIDSDDLELDLEMEDWDDTL